MPIIQRINKIQNLDQLIVDINDLSPNSSDFFNVNQIPAEFPAGKTAFLINGSDNLVLNSEIRIEILDPDRNVIYTQPIQFIEGSSRLISVFVYPTDSFGEAILTLVGKSIEVPLHNNIPIGVPAKKNQLVRWQKKLLINPSLENTSKIRFFKKPIISVTETLRPYLTRTFGSSTGSHELVDGTISGKVAADEFILTSNNFDFHGGMVGAKVFVSSPTITNPSQTGSTTVVITPYTSSIIKVINTRAAIAEFPYQIQTDAQKDIQTIEQKAFQSPPPNTFNFITSPYTMSILTEPTFSATQNIRSFARVNVANMTPFSGDVHLVKLYMKSEGTVGDFELIADQILESTEILIDSSSLKFNLQTGYFVSQSTIDSYWSASVNDITVPTANLLYTSSKIIDSMFITGSDERLNDGKFYKIDNILPVDFDKNAEYTFEAEFHAIKKKAQELLSPDRIFEKNETLTDVDLAKIKVYVSGSAFIPNSPGKRISGEDPVFGKLIQEIELASNSIPSEQTIGKVSKNFIADKTGNGRIIFIVEAGDWHIHNISVKFGHETGFSPDLTTFHVPIRDWQKFDPIKFKAEFYDLNNNKATVFSTSSDITFEGGNSYIGGDNNLITGSIFIGNFTSSGIEMAGIESAFIRTVGYKGFVSASLPAGQGGPGGFMMWSGSVTLGGTTDEYGAVGLEIHGGSGSAIHPDTGIGETHALRFRTDTGILEITGAIQATFISASAGEIGGFTITGDALAGDNFLLSGSATGNEFFISASNFNVKANGDITGSSVLFDGGKIGGFTITGDVLEGTNFLLSGSATGNDFFISASNFNIKANGDITGSSVLFDGGTIAGWQITETLISGSNLLLDPLGTIQTADFVSGLKGWKITSDGNGLAEFENARIRGSLSTTQFVKESINVVGGQLWIANSTALSGSTTASATETTFSVDNSTAWTVGEIAIIKKFDSTGFSTEYIEIVSSSLDGDGVATFNGKIFVSRSIGANIATGSSQITGTLSGDTGSSVGLEYLQGQTIVSTGLSGSGYIRFNANPRDFQTPYIDIIERTGSGVFDLQLKVRIGDLSGISPSLLNGEQSPGHGIYTENGFFSGSVVATVGKIGGWTISNNQLVAGTLVLSGSSTVPSIEIGQADGLKGFDKAGIFLGMEGGIAKLSLVSSGSGGVTTEKFTWNGSTLTISGTVQATDGNIGGWTISNDQLVAGTLVLSGSATVPSIQIGQGSSKGFDTPGIFLGIDSSTEKFSLKSTTTGHFVKWDGTALSISSSDFSLDPKGHITASDALFLGQTLVENTVYRKITIAAGNKDNYFTNVSSSGLASVPTFSLLDLSSEVTGGGAVPAFFIRIDDGGKPDFPIGFIQYPQFSGFANTAYIVIIEGGSITAPLPRIADVTLATAQTISTFFDSQFPDIENRRIGTDPEDWSLPGWQDEKVGSDDYDVFKIESGGRYTLVNNDLDFKLQSINRNDHFLVFKEFWVGSDGGSLNPSDATPRFLISASVEVSDVGTYMEWPLASVTLGSGETTGSVYPQAGGSMRLTNAKVGGAPVLIFGARLSSAAGAALNTLLALHGNRGNVGIGISELLPQDVALYISGSSESTFVSGEVNVGQLNTIFHNFADTDGETIGIGFSADDDVPTANEVGAAIVHEKRGLNSKGKLHFATKNDTTTGGNLPIALTIDEEQKVGIGTTAPANGLHVYTSSVATNALIEVDQDSTGDAAMGVKLSGGQEFTFGIDNSKSGDPFVISDSAELGTTDRFTIISTGCKIQMREGADGASGSGVFDPNADNVIMWAGNSSETGSGAASGDGWRFRYQNNFLGANGDYFIFEKTDGNGDTPDGGYAFESTGTGSLLNMRIDGNGNILMPNLKIANSVNLQINATTGLLTFPVSSKRYKKNIVDIEIDTSKLYNLRPVSFDYNKEDMGRNRDFGLIAEEVLEEIPQLVALNKEGQAESVNYSMLSVILLEENKKLNDRLKKIEEHLNI